MRNYLDELNPQQKAAVTYCDGPQLVIAGAGSGKTRVLTYKIIHLLENGYAPYSILALTFTNKAAREMRSRIESLLGPEISRQICMGTFHSVFSRILRSNADLLGFKSNFTIYDTTDSKNLIKTIIKDFGLDEKVYKPTTIQSVISNAKNSLITPQMYLMNREIQQDDFRSSRPKTGAIYDAYCTRCRIVNAMDFDDLLLYTNILLRDFPEVAEKYSNFFKYILVDEYQDTNFAQHNIILKLANKEGKVCVVGDDAQSIYSFRGANISNILNLSNSFPKLKIYKLEQNYRSTKYIVAAANSLIEKNQRQIRKNVFSENIEGNPLELTKCYSEFEEGAIISGRIARNHRQDNTPFHEMAILYRTNAQSRILEECLRKYNIPYIIYGGLSFYQRKEIKDAVSYMRLVTNPDDDEALKRIINFPARGIGDTTVNKLVAAANLQKTSIWDLIQNINVADVNINAGTKSKLKAFRELISGFQNLNEKGSDAAEITSEIIRSTKMLSMLISDKTPESISKQENLQELVNAVRQYVDTKLEEGGDTSLSSFLSEIALITDQDKETGEKDCVTLMTVHASKGLEFEDVFVAGVEDDLFPSSMSKSSLSEIEEERRLLYVAITRAKNFCMLTYSVSRMKNGMTQMTRISPFIRDIDTNYIYRTDGSGRTIITKRPIFVRQNTSPDNHDSNVNGSGLNQIGTPSTGFSKHDISELEVGMKIVHSRFGEGVITGLDSISEQHRISVNFKNAGKKTLILIYAQFQICK